VSQARPKAILLDAGNTLVFLDGQRLRRVFAESGVTVDEARFRQVELEARAALVTELGRGSNGMEPKAWKRYFKRIFRGVGVPWYRMRRVANGSKAAHAETHLWTHVPAETPPALERLLQDGYRLAVISNADGSVEGLIETVGLSPYFEFVLDSGTVAWEKPDPRIFHSALDRMGIPPDEALYAGDLYHVDVLGARAAGMRSVLIDPWGRTPHDVDRLSSVAALPEFLAGLSG